MRKLAFLSIVLLITLFCACSSVESDAKEAADLNLESLEYIKEKKLEKAEEAYKEALEIIDRYKGTEKYIEFYQLYSEYMLKESLNK